MSMYPCIVFVSCCFLKTSVGVWIGCELLTVKVSSLCIGALLEMCEKNQSSYSEECKNPTQLNILLNVNQQHLIEEEIKCVFS